MTVSIVHPQVRNTAMPRRGMSVAQARLFIVLGALLAWEMATRIAGNSDLIAPPSSIARALFTDVLSDTDIRSAILLALSEVIAAYALAIVVGLALGLAIGGSELSRRSLFPIVLLLYAIPQVVLLPSSHLACIGPAAKMLSGSAMACFL
jgi:NitT/TauT family transport system permease protein